MAGVVDIPTVKLGDSSIPVLAYGTGTTWFKRGDNTAFNTELVESIKTAIKMGYYHLDGAEIYGTEAELGAAIKESGVPREKLFVTTKVYPNISDIPKAFDESLKKLQLDYVDLYLIHSPFFTDDEKVLQSKWADLEKIKASGRVKEIGVSNYTKAHLESTLKTAKIIPAINQIEYHPYLQRRELIDLHKEKGILTAAYGPITPFTRASGGPVDPVVAELAKKYGVSEGEVLLRWAIQSGDVAITTSTKESRLADYLRAVKFTLTPEEVQQITDLGDQKHFRAFWGDKFAADDRS